MLESWLDYTGELEPPEPLARLPQLKHRMKRLLTQLSKVQQIALYSSTWGRQRRAAGSDATQPAEEMQWLKLTGHRLQRWQYSCRSKTLLVQHICSDLTSAAVSPFLKGSVWWNPMPCSACVIYEYLYEHLYEHVWKVSILNQDKTQEVTS